MSTVKFLSRGIDYLGDLGAKLRDLQGFRTLAHELVQNADDAETANSICFDIRDDALFVDNDGVFSQCPDIESDACAWKADGVHNHRCDFHRFRTIASGDKRGQEGTTGAFGIGFIAVYQITDVPELISGGQHWILHEDRLEHERIEICEGCDKCNRSDLPYTRFILPWAQDPRSDLRRALSAETVPLDGPERMIEELRAGFPTAMLFLKRLRTLQIHRNGELNLRLDRVDDGRSLILSNGDSKLDQVWHIVEGDFEEAATRLRVAHPNRIESKRSSSVKLAIPAGELHSGLLCACLPTEHDLELPFHLNADFYTTNDRKRIILGDDYQSAWNREAIRAAALALGKNIDQLPKLLGARSFWTIQKKINDLAVKAEEGRAETVLAGFWNSSVAGLRSGPVIMTTSKAWATVSDASLLLQKEESESVGVLQALGLQIVHEDLRPFQSLLRLKAVGVPVLDVRRVCEALSACDLQGRRELAQLPGVLQTNSGRTALWRELDALLGRNQNERTRSEDEERISEIAIAPGRDGAFWPCKSMYRADRETISLFEHLDVGIPFLAENQSFPNGLARLCRLFDAEAAIIVLQKVETSLLDSLWKAGKLPLNQFVAWFENRRHEVLHNSVLKTALSRLHIFPGADKLRPVSELALPGNFDDPLGIAELVDLAALGERREFLRDLGMVELDFPTYATSKLPKILMDDELPVEKRRATVQLLAERLGELKDSQAARGALSKCALVECRDHSFRAAADCYFDSAQVSDCLERTANFALLPKSHAAAVHDLYGWLGVASQPRMDHLLNRVRELAKESPGPSVAQAVQRIVAHLGQRYERPEDFSSLAALRTTKWLPARGKSDRWYAPNELYADYQAYLFESQALFLDLPNRVQTSSRPFLEYLGLGITPPTPLVVKHLLHQASQSIPVNAEVYRVLNDRADDPVLAQLRGKPCLWIGEAYRLPNQVFWGEHPFGRYRWRLGDQLRAYGKLLSALSVCEAPTGKDVIGVLKEIALEFGATGRSLDDEGHAVLMNCWRSISGMLRTEGIAKQDVQALHSIKCVPDKTRVLNPPDWMFFENRAGLVEKFGDYIARNVIPRPLDTGDALSVAGMRSLGTAVAVELIECRSPKEDPGLSQRIGSRRNEIARVLDALSTEYSTVEVLDHLQGIECHVAESIEIRYRLDAFNRHLESAVERVPALYQAEANALLYARRDQTMPWASIARELAVALYPDEDPGRFAAGLKEALAPDTAGEAAAVLDELGFARLDTSVAVQLSNANTAVGLGTDAPVGSQDGNGSGSGQQPVGPISTGAAIESLLGQGAPPPTPPADPPGSPEPTGAGSGAGHSRNGGGAGGGARHRSGHHAPAKRSPGSQGGRPFISYVAAHPSEEEPDPDGLDALKRQALEEQAIRLILADEPELQRTPRHNPGYDLFEADDEDQPIRWVEVKAMSGGLIDRPVGMSHTQFECAQEHGGDFWLYVVEHAADSDARIIRIQDPAGKSRTFTFDQGWLAVAENDNKQTEPQDERQNVED